MSIKTPPTPQPVESKQTETPNETKYTNDLIVTSVDKLSGIVLVEGYVRRKDALLQYSCFIIESDRLVDDKNDSSEGLIMIKVSGSWYKIETKLEPFPGGKMRAPIDFASIYYKFMPAAVYAVMVGAAITIL